MYAITAATGKLGHLVVENILKHIPASQLILAVRNPEKAAGWAARGVQVRQADYDRPETMIAALEGAEKVLLISADRMGKRLEQHSSVIHAAKQNNVKLLAYTSVLYATESPLQLASEHKQTEEAILASGVPFVMLRNGWYTDNHLQGRDDVETNATLYGASGDGRWSSASRADYAEAAVAVLTSSEDQSGKIYELAGDTSWTEAELAAELSRQMDKSIEYQNLSEDGYLDKLIQAGLPRPVAEMLADTEAGAANGLLENNDKILSRLIGRPTTTLSESIKALLSKS